MAEIESLDLAQLENNPSSVAEAVADLIEAEGQSLNAISDTLLPQANDKLNDIDQVYQDSLTTKNSIDDLLNQAGSRQSAYFTSGYSGNWDAKNITNSTTGEDGLRVMRWGYIYVFQMSIVCDPAPALYSWSDVIQIAYNDIQHPSNSVLLGSYVPQGGTNDLFVRMYFSNTGVLKLLPISNNGDGPFQIIGNFVGIDI